MRLTEYEKRRAEKRAEQILKDSTVSSLDGLLEKLLGGKPNPTQKAFIYDAANFKAYKGPMGCAKTSTICAAGFLRALLHPGSIGLVGRHDYNDLVTTTAKRMEEMLHRLPEGVLLERDKSPPMRWIVAADSNREPSEIRFMGLKDGLGSQEFTWAIVDEANEVEEERVHEIDGRMRIKGQTSMLALAFNPPPKTHWLYQACTGKDFQEVEQGPPWLKLFEPEPKENVQNLQVGYYERLTRHYSKEMRHRLIEGNWGANFTGQPVYREFKVGLHTRHGLKEQFNKNATLIRFWDFGYQRPACGWMQLDAFGRLLVLAEKLGKEQEATQFARQVKGLTATLFPGAKYVVDYGDPAGAQKKDTGETFKLLYDEGITVISRSSTIDEGVQLIRRALERLIEGQPAILFDSQHCPILIEAMQGGYHMDSKVHSPRGPQPYKDGFYDHLADAFRYGCLHVLGTGLVGAPTAIPANLAYRDDDEQRTGFDVFAEPTQNFEWQDNG